MRNVKMLAEANSHRICKRCVLQDRYGSLYNVISGYDEIGFCKFIRNRRVSDWKSFLAQGLVKQCGKLLSLVGSFAILSTFQLVITTAIKEPRFQYITIPLFVQEVHSTFIYIYHGPVILSSASFSFINPRKIVLSFETINLFILRMFNS